MPKYEYSPLDSSRDEVRFIRLLPGKPSHDIQIQIYNFPLNLENPPRYEALSYTWGSPNDRDTITILPDSVRLREDGPEYHLSITHNLFSALRHLRYNDTYRVLWIDAICINQEDMAERAHQVQRMDKIYSLASQVVVWLGPEQDDSAFAVQFLSEWGAKVELDWQTNGLILDENEESNLWMTFESDETPPSWPRSFDAIFALLARSYFERLWIRQEISLANDAVIVVGNLQLPWRVFRNAICSFGGKGIDHLVEDDDGLDPKREERQRLQLQVHNLCLLAVYPLPVVDLLKQASYWKCVDPRDKIYGVLGMVPDLDKAFVEGTLPSYEIPVQTVYRDACLQILECSEHLDFLRNCEIDGEAEWRPTWVPDWSVPHRTNTLISGYADGKALPETSHQDNVLRVSGLKVAAVEAITRFDFAGESLLASENLFSVMSAFIQDMKSHASEAPYKNCHEAICDLFCIGDFKENWIPPQTSAPELESLPQELQIMIESRHAGSKMKGEYSENMFKMLNRAAIKCENKDFVRCQRGYVGLAPRGIRVGDVMAVILGCSNVLALRPARDGEFMVVGESYVPGLNNGEALLGGLPEGWRMALVLDEDGMFRTKFKEEAQTVWQKLDPRIKWSELDDGDGGMKKPDAEYFRKRGVRLEQIQLI